MAGLATNAALLLAACGSAATSSPPIPSKYTIHGALVEVVGGPQTLELTSRAGGHLTFSLQDAALVGRLTTVHVGLSGQFVSHPALTT
jgi:hypothetical protein